jgi:SAM-dependent methyltransferase
MEGTLKDRERVVSDGWGAWAARREDDVMSRIAWAEFPPCTAYINRLVSGGESKGWLEFVAGLIEKPGELGLSICCGSGYVERQALELGMARAMEGTDISEDALEIARRSAEGLPITYRRLDLNRDELEPGRYDFVVSAAGLHHVTNLEHCVHQLWRSLKPGGLLLMNEFVGPDRFQWTDEQLEEMNRLFVPLPVEKRHNLMTGVTSERIERRPLAYMIEADPSEAVRSSEIIGTVSLFFEPFVVREFGGTVLHPMLEGIAGNFDMEDEKDRAVVRSLIEAEERLVSSGELPADFLILAGRKRDVAPADVEGLLKEGNERSAIIERQEAEILELTRRLEEAERRNLELVDIAEGHKKEYEELKRELEVVRQKNEELLSAGLLGRARYAYRRLRRR